MVVRNHRTYFGIFFSVSLDAENEDDCSSNCEHKSELENLNKLISPDDNKIPDNLWKIFPVKGQYIKNILIYSGYETFDSIIKLNDDSKLTEPISFVKEMSEIMDENEKRENFGIFANHPDKLRIIPGLKPVISRFIESVEKLTATESTAKCHQKASASKEKSTKRKKQSENSPSPPSSEIIDK